MRKNKKNIPSFALAIIILFVLIFIIKLFKSDKKPEKIQPHPAKNSMVGFKSDKYLNDIEKLYDSNDTFIDEKDKDDSNEFKNKRVTDDYLYTKIEKIIDEETEDLKGDWQVAVDTISGKSNISIEKKSSDENEAQVAASTIKIFIALETYRQVEEGILDEKDVEDDIYLMLRDSNNEATDRLIDKIGDNDMKTARLNVGRMINKVTGKNRCALYTKMHGKGKANLVNAKDLNKALIVIYDGEIISREHCDIAMKAMSENTTTSKIKLLADLPKKAKGLNKSGEYPDGGIENDIAIIDVGDSVFAISFLSDFDEPVSHGGSPQFESMHNLGRRISNAFIAFDKDN